MSETDLIAELTTSIVAAFVAHNRVPVGDVAALITNTHSALLTLGADPEPPAAPPPVPAVPIKKSVTHEAIFSLETGKAFKTLKRHVSELGMTPDQYRAKWGLPKDYPMVAPAYAERRSEMAKQRGFGGKIDRGSAPATGSAASRPEQGARKRGRPPKAK